ncbi:M20/M25/M40 family metallo-hydrolase [Williamwhitmania taraxaci]|uniref:Carboxypeptidase Q n=1 Tax=Williamwhitmania taraxaci TaxID=1640674 RepID=A0A1G6IJV0_9BACT|nr:M20/M25/M40 family metallo-hydrolase [Williamwhitmania taraxaci]SDC06703.1 Peptidase family M28 [Williamwhitmania taraxaci]
MRKLVVLTLIAFGFCSCYAQENSLAISLQNDSIVIASLYKSALTSSGGYDNLRELTSKAPHRLAGSEGCANGIKILFNQLKALNPDTVYLQPAMALPWLRGEKEVVYIELPKGKRILLHASALGGSVGTGLKGLAAEVVEVKSFEELKALGEANVKGKIVFYNLAMDPALFNPGEGYGRAAFQRTAGASEAAKYGAIATLVRSLTNRIDTFPHTGVMRYADTTNMIPSVAISTFDAELLSTRLKSDPTQRVFIRTTCKSLPAVVSYNVIAELKGGEKPEEIITIGGHLDSWDLGEGAHDDGVGCMHAMEVIRLFKQNGIQPKRTIRVVLFLDEETHQVGAKAYAASVKDKGEKIYVGIESDSGGGAPKGFGMSASPAQMESFRQLMGILAPYDLYQLRNGGGGVDVGFLKPLGVPTMNVLPSPHRYFYYHHSAFDTFKEIDMREVQLGCAAHAALVYLIDKYDTLGS